MRKEWLQARRKKKSIKFVVFFQDDIPADVNVERVTDAVEDIFTNFIKISDHDERHNFHDANEKYVQKANRMWNL